MNRIEAVGHVVSASMLIATSHAMAHVSIDALAVRHVEDGGIDADTRARIVAAMSRADFKKGTAEVVPLIAKGFGENGVSLADLVQMAGASGQDDHTGPRVDDPEVNPAGGTNGGVSCYNNCYTNCYSNCHGSRGWR